MNSSECGVSQGATPPRCNASSIRSMVCRDDPGLIRDVGMVCRAKKGHRPPAVKTAEDQHPRVDLRRSRAKRRARRA